jgi:dTMP kinase
VRKAVAPSLAAGTWVLCDRFADSTMAYQGYAQQVDRDQVARVNRLAAGETWPDLTLILDLPVADGLLRARGRKDGEDRYERMGGDFHERIRAAFLEIATGDPARCSVIDARGDEETVAARVWDAVQARLTL